MQLGTDEHGHFIEVEDNGVGMSRAVMTGYLLDFGRSFWSGSEVSEELPGLLRPDSNPPGNLGSAFFPFLCGAGACGSLAGDTQTRELIPMSSSSLLVSTQTAPSQGQYARVSGRRWHYSEGWLDKDPEGPGGVLQFRGWDSATSEPDIIATCTWLCPALDTNLFAQRRDESRTTVLRASDWKTLSDKDLVHRLIPGDLEEGRDEDDDTDEFSRSELIRVIISMLRPLYDFEGNLVGRLAIVPSYWRGTGFNLAWSPWAGFGLRGWRELPECF